MCGLASQPYQTVFLYRKRGFGVPPRDENDDCKQIVEPARHWHTGDVLAVGNEPAIRGRKKCLEIFVSHAVDQRDICKIGLGIALEARRTKETVPGLLPRILRTKSFRTSLIGRGLSPQPHAKTLKSENLAWLVGAQ